MSPQPSNRGALIEGALRCLERLPPERVTARAIADESGANPASIAYHFGSKDRLVTEAVIAGLDRWLAEIERGMGEEVPGGGRPADRLHRAAEVMEATRRDHTGLARAFLTALAKAQHDPELARTLAAGFAKTRPALAELIGLGDDQVGEDAGGLILAMFDGLLFQALLDPGLAIEGERMRSAQARLRRALPAERS
ncbi:MAG: TetR/AcrR family transcriptional regulator [Solirubrobacterales bacterium]